VEIKIQNLLFEDISDKVIKPDKVTDRDTNSLVIVRSGPSAYKLVIEH